MKKLALIAALLSSNVLSSWDDPYKPFNTKSNSHETMIITWKPVANVQAACKAEFKRRNFAAHNGEMDACSFWEDNKCLIITKRNPTMHDLGHELRHCYQGDWH